MALPADLVRHEVLPFLSLRCLVQLDSAVCDTEGRTHLMASMAEHTLSRHHFSKGLDCYKWVLSRRMRLSWFSLDSEVDIKLLLPLSPIFESVSALLLSFPLPDESLPDFTVIMQPISLKMLDVGYGWSTQWNEGILCSLLTRHTNLREITLSGGTHITNELFQCMAQHCGLLESLSVECSLDYVFDDSVLSQLFSACVHIRKIYWYGAAVSETMMQGIGKHSKKLENLLVSCSTLTDTGLLSVVQGCHKLRSLSIEATPHLTVTGLVLCSAHLTQLCELTVSDAMLGEEMLPFFKNCSSLTTFYGALTTYIY